MTDPDHTTTDTEAIRARADAATPGPWRPETDPEASPGVWTDMGAELGFDTDRAEDAEFIAHARTDIPALLDALATVTTERDEARRKLTGLAYWLHSHRLYPGWEYETTTGQRKAWDRQNEPPEGDGWERNTDAGIEGWERFEYHEESYWRRQTYDAFEQTKDGQP